MQSFDENINRSIVPALKVHSLVIGHDDNPTGHGMFAAGVADMDFKAPPVVITALQNRLNHGVFGYETVSDGLILSLTKWQASRHQWKVDDHHVLRAPNILNILAIAASLFTDEDDGIIVQPPVFFDFYDILRENNRSLVLNPLILENGRYRMDFADLEQKAANPRTKMIYLCNPHNPMGRIWRPDELRKLGDICIRHQVLIVADEIHGDLALSGHKFTPFASLGDQYADNSISCLSPAKTFNIASCCSAFTIISNDERRKAFQIENSRLTVNKNNAFANVAMQAAYSEGEAWLNDVLAYLQSNLDLLKKSVNEMPKIQIIEPEGGFLVWVDFRALNLAPDKLTEFLRIKAKWAITRGLTFGQNGAGFARLNIACPYQNLSVALNHLKKAVHEL